MWQPDENALSGSEKLLQAFDTKKEAQDWIKENVTRGHYEGADYNGNQVDVVGVDYYQLTGTDGEAKWCVIGR